MKFWCAIAVTLTVLSACGGEDGPSGFENIALEEIRPGILVPGTELHIRGQAFVEEPWGKTSLRVHAGGSGKAIARIPATYVDREQLRAVVDKDVLDALGMDQIFEGMVQVDIESRLDGRVYSSPPVSVVWDIRSELAPELAAVQAEPLMFVNDPVAIKGGGFLIGKLEGEARAVIDGCFMARASTRCNEIERQEVVLKVNLERTRAEFPFVPAIAGIGEGVFQGQVTIKNVHRGGRVLGSRPLDLRVELTRPVVLSLDPPAGSLGQYVHVHGGGFVGGRHGGLTLFELSGVVEREGMAPMSIQSLYLVPEFSSGRVQRYVLSEDDAFGRTVNLRGARAIFNGTLRPVVLYEGEEVRGDATRVTLEIAPIKQLVYVIFRPSYSDSLRHFGLGAVDHEIRRRVVEVIERDYATINLEVRTEQPTDFAYYSELEIAGPDVNRVGLLGYDNTPGKDSGNRRLFDKIGGFNATTQRDGFAGYGGVFIESLFAFSTHPKNLARRAQNADNAFDRIFDPFRPDQRGKPVVGRDVEGLTDLQLKDARDCPSSERIQQIRCAIWVLGNLIGTTASHEIGHSIGLANPHGSGFHNPGDEPNRLMDAGGNRPFAERAELFDQGPAMICDSEYDYLREIMPAPEPVDGRPRPPCF